MTTIVKSTRRCPVCTNYRPHKDFYFRSGKPGGYCKECTKAKALDWGRRNRENVVGIKEAQRLRDKDAEYRRLRALDKQLVGEKICRHCLEQKAFEQFYVIEGCLDSYCKQCRLQIDKDGRSKSPERMLSTLLGAARTRARNANFGFDLTVEFLVQLWERQGGCCAYTNEALTYLGDRATAAVSIDRVDSTLGYLKRNVVLCSRRVNEMKSNMTVEELVELCCKIVSVCGEQKEKVYG